MRQTIHSWLSTLQRLGYRKAMRTPSREPRRQGLWKYTRQNRFESLEDRRLLALVTVNNNSDTISSNANLSSIAALIASPGTDGISLREAILAANQDVTADEIRFAPSLIGATIELTMGEYYIANALKIDGEWWNITITAGNGTDSIPGTFDGHRIFGMPELSATYNVELVGLTLTGGDVPGYGGAVYSNGANLAFKYMTISGNTSGSGGGVHVYGGSLAIEYSSISNNYSSWEGGGIYYQKILSGADLEIISSSVSGNTSRARGGGIYARADGGSVLIQDSTFDGNTKTDYTGYEGGGIYLKCYPGSTVTMTNTTISNNNALGPGANAGGMKMYLSPTSTVTLDGLRILNNVAADDAGGIYIYNVGSSVTLRNSTISGNTATDNDLTYDGGGGAAFETLLNGTTTIENSTINDNRAVSPASGHPGDVRGGGLLINGTTGTVTTILNSTISNNWADGFGGGVWINPDFQGGQVRIRHSTITNNRADIDNDGIGTGGGIYRSGVSTPVTVDHSIVAGNFRGSGVGAPANNIVGTVTSTFSLTSGDPLLHPLADNGGPTLTHMPKYNSPAIDAGNLSIPSPPATDQRGATRIVNGNTNLDVRIDIGAVEAPYIIVSTPVDELDTDYSLNDLSLREALVIAASRPGKDIIAFAPNVVAAGTITLSYDGPDSGSAVDVVDINSNVVIDGPGFNALTIDANYSTSYVLRLVAGASDVELKGLHLKRGTLSGIYERYASMPHLLLDGMKVSGNSNNPFSSGAGIEFGLEGSLTILNSEIVDNLRTGVTFYTAGLLTIENSTIANNLGVGLSVALAGAKVTNSTISGNSTATTSAAGASAGMASITFVNSTIVNNRADRNMTSGTSTATGGVFASNSGTIVLHNTIVAGNFAGATSNPSQVARDVGRVTSGVPGSFHTSSSYNLIGADPNLIFAGVTGLGNDVGGQSGAPTINPQLGPLTDNGGPTRTHALLAISPARDSGNEANIPSGVNKDQRGFARIANGAVDKGSFEYAASIVVSALADENDGNYAAGRLSLREALGLANQLAGNDTIVFDSSLFDNGIATITLSYDGADAGTAPDTLAVGGGVTIDGPGANVLSISGNGQTGVVNVGYGHTAILRGLRVTGGAASTGAGLSNGGSLTLDRVQIDGNSGSLGAGIFSSGSLNVSNSTIANNVSTGTGGGIYVWDGAATIKNSTVSGNTASGGGGIYVDFGTATIVNSTITANRANAGSGVLGGATMHNSIVAGNLTATGAPTTADIAGWFGGSTFNLIGRDGNMGNGLNHGGAAGNKVGGEYGGGAIDPLLSTLDYFGGTTKTHRLLSGSDAIDAGSNAVALAYSLDDDQRGECRITDCMEDDEDPCVDMGAVELAFDEVYS